MAIQRIDNGEDILMHFFTSELQLRGSEIAKQPHYDADRQNIFCWNGEVKSSLYLSPGLLIVSADI